MQFHRKLLPALLVIACGPALALEGGAGAAAAAAAGEGVAKTFKKGPFEISVGLVDEAVRVGVSSKESWEFGKRPKTDECTPPAPGAVAECRAALGAVEVSLDGSWKNEDGALNYGTLGFRPQWLYERYSVRPTVVSQVPAKCADLATALSDPECIVPRSTKSSSLSFAVFPDVTYRYGDYEVAGTRFEANQMIYSGGFTTYFPATIGGSATGGSPIWHSFATAPYLELSYAKVDDIDSDNPPPPPDGVKDEYLVAEGDVALYVPWSELYNGQPWIAHANVVGSREADGGDWEYARSYELLIQLEDELQVAASYKSGSDKGFDYDRQVLLGIVYTFLGVK